MESGKNTSSQILTKSLITGFWIILLGKIHTSIFNHTMIGNPLDPYPSGSEHYTLLVGTLQTGQIQIPVVYSILYRNTILFAIGISVIFTGILFSILFANNGHRKVSRNFMTVGTLATMVVVLNQPLKQILRPLWVTALANNEMGKSFFFGMLIGDSFAIFPFVGYAFYGAIFGMAFHLELPTEEVNRYMGIAAAMYILSGIFYLLRYGHPPIQEAQETPSIQWNYIQIGALIFFCLLIYNIHFGNITGSFAKLFQSSKIRRFGMLTLTIFIMEALLGITIKVFILDNLFGDWSSSLLLAGLYGVSLVFIWHFILLLWERIDYVGSWEWINGRALAYFTGKESTQLKIKENLTDQPPRTTL